MNYSIKWDENNSIVTFTGDTNIRDVELANKDIHGDNRTYKQSGSIWDFSKCSSVDVKPEELSYTFAVDLGSTKTLKTFKLAFVLANTQDTKLFDTYITNSVNRGSPWEFKIFYSLNDAAKWINA